MNEGKVYILSNEFHRDILKIGYTNRSVDTRCRELSTQTGVLGEYKVEYSCAVPYCSDVERQIHDALEKYQVKREFFRIDIDSAKETLIKIAIANYEKLFRKLMKPYRELCEMEFGSNYRDFLNEKRDKLSQVNNELDWFRDIFKHKGKYHKAVVHHEICSFDEYNDWLSDAE